jgi:hypothetical protein
LQIAVNLLEDVLARQIDVKELGWNHPETAETMSILAWGYALMERWDDSLEQRKNALEVQRHTLGSTHPETLLSRSEIGYICLEQGDVFTAKEHLEMTLKLQEIVLGKAAHETQVTKTSLAKARKVERKREAKRLRK